MLHRSDTEQRLKSLRASACPEEMGLAVSSDPHVHVLLRQHIWYVLLPLFQGKKNKKKNRANWKQNHIAIVPQL